MRVAAWAGRLTLLVSAGALLITVAEARLGGQGRSAHDLQPLYGVTAQDGYVEFRLDSSCRPHKFILEYTARCSDGSRFTSTWIERPEGPGRFVWEPPSLTARADWRERARGWRTTWRYRLEGRLWAEAGRAAGVATLLSRSRGPDGETVSCRTIVPFAAGEGARRMLARRTR